MKKIKNQKGQALVEFAIILPLLLLLVMGIIQFGMVINSYLSVQNAVREGARSGIVGSTDTEMKLIMKATAPSLKEEDLTINITPSAANRSSGKTLTIKAIYSYPLTIPIINKIFSNPILLNAEISMRIE